MPSKPRPSGATQRAPLATPQAPSLRGRLQLEKNGVNFLGPLRVDLLEAIGVHGSITRAAKAVGLSYKAAWDAVESMNNQASSALVTRSAGGSRGGGTTLTAYGEQVVTLVRTIEREHASILAVLDDPRSALSAYTRLSRQLSLRTSARNQWVGRIVGVLHDDVRTQVQLSIAPDTIVHADISTHSAERLFIQVGMDICALVKATAVSMRPWRPEANAGYDNRLRATVSHVMRGDRHVEVTATLAGDRTVTAVIPANAEAVSVLDRGVSVSVHFAPAQVLLVQLT
jgi:molybdate transport system regulatory protein